MKLFRTWAVFSSLLTLVAIPAAHAAEGTYYLGLNAGVGLLNAGAGPRFNWEFNAGGEIMPTILVGAYYSYIPFGSVSSPSGISVSGSEKFYGVEGRYDFMSLLPGFSAGLRAGLSSVSTQAVVPGKATDEESSNGFAWGPVFEYDQPLSRSFTFGGQLYLMVPSEAAANNFLGLLATIKYWF